MSVNLYKRSKCISQLIQWVYNYFSMLNYKRRVVIYRERIIVKERWLFSLFTLTVTEGSLTTMP